MSAMIQKMLADDNKEEDEFNKKATGKPNKQKNDGEGLFNEI